MRPSVRSLRAWGYAAGPPGVLIVLGLATAWKSTGLGYWTPIGPGPGFFPLWLGILLSVLAVVWAFQRHRPVPLDSEEVTADPNHIDVPEEMETPIPYKRALVTVVSLVVLATVMPSLGYKLSMLIFLLLHLKLGTKANWVTTILISVAGSFGVYAVFTNLLQVYLPSATIPFLHSLGL